LLGTRALRQGHVSIPYLALHCQPGHSSCPQSQAVASHEEGAQLKSPRTHSTCKPQQSRCDGCSMKPKGCMALEALLLAEPHFCVTRLPQFDSEGGGLDSLMTHVQHAQLVWRVDTCTRFAASTLQACMRACTRAHQEDEKRGAWTGGLMQEACGHDRPWSGEGHWPASVTMIPAGVTFSLGKRSPELSQDPRWLQGSVPLNVLLDA
jgi:hypothetical protein